MKFHRAVRTTVPTRVHREVQARVHRAVHARVHRAVQPKVLHKKGEGYVLCTCVNINTMYLYLYMYITIVLYSTPPDICGTYVEEEPWFDSERQGCP